MKKMYKIIAFNSLNNLLKHFVPEKNFPPSCNGHIHVEGNNGP